MKVDSPERRARKQFKYGKDYKKKAKWVRENSTHCHLCHQPFTHTDTIEADHIYPELGNESPLLAAHRKCNRERGNTPLP